MGYGKLKQAAIDLIDSMNLRGLIGSATPSNGQVLTWGAGGAAFAAASAAGLGSAVVVDSAGGGDETTFADAITAASSGQTVVCLDAGSYAGFTLSKSGVDVFAPFVTFTSQVVVSASGANVEVGSVQISSGNDIPVVLSALCNFTSRDRCNPNLTGTATQCVTISSQCTARFLGGCYAGTSTVFAISASTGRVNLESAETQTQVVGSNGSLIHQTGAASTHFTMRGDSASSNWDPDTVFDIDAGTVTLDVSRIYMFASTGNAQLWNVASGATLKGRIDVVEGWTTANTTTGTAEVTIGNEPTTWDHPDIGTPTHYFAMDEASGNLADGVGALALGPIGTTADLVYSQPGAAPGVGRWDAIHHTAASGAGFESTTTVGSAVAGDFTIAFVVNHRDKVPSTLPLVALYDTAAARSAGHINIHTTTGVATDHLSVSVDGSFGGSSPLFSPLNWGWGERPTLVALKRSGTTMTLWVDGVQVDSATVTATDYSGLDLGVWRLDATDAAAYGQPCTISRLGIWNSALSDAALQAMVDTDGTLRTGIAA